MFRLPSSYGASRLPIVLDDVSCAGGEPGLSFCAYATAHDCSHEEDVGVRCTGGWAGGWGAAAPQGLHVGSGRLGKVAG